MDFNLNLMEAGKMTSESSAMEYSGGGSPSFTAAPFFENFPCTLMQRRESMEAMRETIFRMAVMQPVHVEAMQAAPRRKNVKISTDPQSVAARHRRERISHRIRTLQRMVPGGSKMDTASMLDEAVHYLKFLKKQVELLQQAGESNRRVVTNGCWNISNAFNYANV